MCFSLDKSEKLIAAWSLYFSNEKIQPVSIEKSQFHITENETVFFQSKSNNNKFKTNTASLFIKLLYDKNINELELHYFSLT